MHMEEQRNMVNVFNETNFTSYLHLGCNARLIDMVSALPIANFSCDINLASFVFRCTRRRTYYTAVSKSQPNCCPGYTGADCSQGTAAKTQIRENRFTAKIIKSY